MFKALLMTMKPQSFLLSAISVSTGTALASLHGPIHWGFYLVTVLGVILLHGGSNVINDYFDYRQKSIPRMSREGMEMRQESSFRRYSGRRRYYG